MDKALAFMFLVNSLRGGCLLDTIETLILEDPDYQVAAAALKILHEPLVKTYMSGFRHIVSAKAILFGFYGARLETSIELVFTKSQSILRIINSKIPGSYFSMQLCPEIIKIFSCLDDTIKALQVLNVTDQLKLKKLIKSNVDITTLQTRIKAMATLGAY